MYSWFTPDAKQGVWHDNEDLDRYRRQVFQQRLPMQRIYHIDSGIIPNYSGYVPGELTFFLVG